MKDMIVVPKDKISGVQSLYKDYFTPNPITMTVFFSSNLLSWVVEAYDP